MEMMKWLLAALLAGLLAPATCLTPQEEAVWKQAQSVTPQGQVLVALIDSMDVAHRWQNDVHIAWFSGLPNHADATSGVATHCSAFVSALCERLGVYILRPPEHSQVLLANQQHDWVQGATGQGQGWSKVGDPVTAQALANRGLLVLYLRKNADPSKPGHAAVVRPYAQTNRTRVLLRGPRIAQASTVNSPSTDMDLSAKTNYYWAVFQRPAQGPSLVPMLRYPRWSGSGMQRLLFDAAPGGRLDAFKLFYASDGSPTWRLAAGGLPAAASGAAGSTATLAASWYSLTLSSSAKQEPYLTKEEGQVAFTIAGGGARLSVAEGGGSPGALSTSAALSSPLNGWWYAAVDDAAYGLFVYSSRTSPGLLDGFLLEWSAASGAPTWRHLHAAWASGKPIAGAAAATQLARCRSKSAGPVESCSYSSSPAGLQLSVDPARLNATLAGLPGQPPLVLQKAGVMTPVLSSTPFA